MRDKAKKICLQELISKNIPDVESYYTKYNKVLEDIGDYKFDYISHMTDSPINCELELKRLPNADYDLCCALLTILLREDYSCNGSFEERYDDGQVQPILERMINLLG